MFSLRERSTVFSVSRLIISCSSSWRKLRFSCALLVRGMVRVLLNGALVRVISCCRVCSLILALFLFFFSCIFRMRSCLSFS